MFWCSCKRVAQTDGAAGVFLAVDGQPDGTVARKRFWRGNFLFAQDPALGGPGFKRFRPVVRGKDGALRRLANAEIAKDPQYGDFSLDQSKLDIEDFYDRMDDVMSPAPLDPLRAMKEAITALEEQVKTRVTSVENGRKYHAGGGGEVAMPDGASIFETTGAWEDFATPSRDLRLLIAIDVVRGFPDRVARRPERYAMPAGKERRGREGRAGELLASELAARKFSYTRSDGSQWTLALKDVVDRAADLEMAYNVERLRRAALGRAGQQRRGVDVQAARAGGAAREDDGVPRVVPRAPPPAAALVFCRDDQLGHHRWMMRGTHDLKCAGLVCDERYACGLAALEIKGLIVARDRDRMARAVNPHELERDLITLIDEDLAWVKHVDRHFPAPSLIGLFQCIALAFRQRSCGKRFLVDRYATLGLDGSDHDVALLSLCRAGGMTRKPSRNPKHHGQIDHEIFHERNSFPTRTWCINATLS